MGRKKVLLLGNGLNRAFGGLSWGELMSRINTSVYDAKKLTCPMLLQAILVTQDHIGQIMKGYKAGENPFYGSVESEELRGMLRKLLLAGFSDILTTNYSYELEIAATGNMQVSDRHLIHTCRTSVPGKRKEPKYLLHTYQKVEYDHVENRVWHIHGEARKPDSMILGHYYYAALLNRIVSYVNKRGSDYQNGDGAIKSWIDSFLLGDVYVHGYGLDYSEMDLWWLLNRKKRENAEHGRVFFFTPDRDVEKEGLLSLLDVDVSHSGSGKAAKKADEGARYKAFYESAIREILDRMRFDE